MSDLNPDDWFRDPNDGAYEKTEERTGPPLEYVAEKMRRSLHSCHELVINLKGDERLSFHASAAFRYGTISYLGLQNMLALINEGELFARLEQYSSDDFSEWLDRIDQEGSVTG